MEPKFTTWDDVFNADYPDQRLAQMVTVGIAQTYHNMIEELLENKIK